MLIDLNFLNTNSLNSLILIMSILKPAAILWPPPLISKPLCTAPIIVDPKSNPGIDLPEPFPVFLLTEMIIVGLLNFSFILAAIIPIIPSCQFSP